MHCWWSACWDIIIHRLSSRWHDENVLRGTGVDSKTRPPPYKTATQHEDVWSPLCCSLDDRGFFMMRWVVVGPNEQCSTTHSAPMSPSGRQENLWIISATRQTCRQLSSACRCCFLCLTGPEPGRKAQVTHDVDLSLLLCHYVSVYFAMHRGNAGLRNKRINCGHALYINFFAWFLATFTFAICCRPSVCLSPCRLSSVTLVHPTKAVWNFPQYFYAIWYLGRPLTFRKNCREIVPEEPLRVES